MSGTRLVVAGIFVREGRLLMSRRPAGRAWAGLWELPGGKVEAGETPEEALVREWREEMDVTPVAVSSSHFETVDEPAPEGARQNVTLLFYEVGGIVGAPRSAAVDAVRFASAPEARILPTPPGDAAALRRLLAEVEGDAFIDTETEAGLALVREHLSRTCRNHGAVFRPEDGRCVAGPCEGESLTPLDVARSGAGWALDGGGMR